MKTIIFGVNAFSEMLYQYLIDDEETEVVGFTIEKKYIKGSENTSGLPLVPFEELPDVYPPDQYGVFVCIGYHSMNDVRKRVFQLLREKGYQILSYIHPSATILTDRLGIGTIVLERACIGACVQMGEGNIIYPMAHVAHHSLIGNYNFFAINSVVGGKVQIEDNCFFGMNSTVKNRVTVKSYTLVGAGCYIAKDTEENGCYVPPRSYKLEGRDSRSLI